AQVFRLPDLAPRLARDRPHASAPRNINMPLVDYGIGLGQRQPLLIDAKLLSDSLLTRARVERGHAFVKEPQPAVQQERRAVLVERVEGLVAVSAPAGGRHLDLALQIALP